VQRAAGKNDCGEVGCREVVVRLATRKGSRPLSL
jgi:hypothetical protein